MIDMVSRWQRRAMMVVVGMVGCGGRVVVDHESAEDAPACAPASWYAYRGQGSAQLTPDEGPIVWAARLGPFTHDSTLERMTLAVDATPARFAVGALVTPSAVPDVGPLDLLSWDEGEPGEGGRTFVQHANALAGEYAFLLVGAGKGANMAITATSTAPEGRAWQWMGGVWTEVEGELVGSAEGCEIR